MLESGEWRPTKPGTDPRVRGYHLNALYSPVGWLSWGGIATGFVKSKKDPQKLRVWTNTVLGETWTERGEAPEWERLWDRREPYPLGSVPRGGLFLTAGVDVQKDRIVVEIVAWGRGKTSWSIDYGVIPGDTADLDKGPWPQLDALLARAFVHEDGAELAIRMMAIDSGYNTQTVYTWCRKYPLNRVIAVKGQASGGPLIGTPSSVDINLRGRRPTHGYKVWPVTGDVAKSELYGFLKLEQPTDGSALPPGWCHFSQYDEDYFKQLTAEQLVTHKSRTGYVRLEWELIPGRENHTLDCRVYARAAAALVGLDRFKEPDWLQLERAVSASPDPPAPPPAPRESWLHRHRRRG
jgi:phage terminase large subunit GpA-like protein